jgi:hypothetical protein
VSNQILNFHKYESVFFPIFLSEKYGSDVVKAVWQHAEELGADTANPDFLVAVGEVVDSASLDPANIQARCVCHDDQGECVETDTIRQDLASTMAEFSVWNYFTGPYAGQAPEGIGYSEAEFYSAIPLDSVDVRTSYPSRTVTDPTPHVYTNGATYIRLENLQSLNLDSLLLMFVKPDASVVVRWAISAIFQMEDDPDSHLVASQVVDVWETYACTDSVANICGDWICTDSVYLQGISGGRYLADMLGDWTCVRCKVR